MVLDLDPDNLRRAVAALSGLGYRPRAPVPFAQFVDAGTRARWIREKGLTVFSLFSPEHLATEVDLFVEAPLDFGPAYASAVRIDVAPSVPATFASLENLIALKERAGRPQDLEDIERLRSLRGRADDE